MKLRMIAIVLMLPIMINLLVFSSTDVIVEAQTIRVTGVQLNYDEIRFDRLQTERRLIPTVLPAAAHNRAVTFSSSNEAVAIVDEFGDVTAISNGFAVITVTTDDGAHTAQTTVTVESYFIEKFNVQIGEPEEGSEEDWNPHSATMFTETNEYVIVTIDPTTAMVQNVPFIVAENPNIVHVSQFELDETSLNDTHERTFKARVTALRPGETTLRVFINERASGDTLERHLDITVEQLADEHFRFEFDSLRFDQDNPLVTASREVPLRVSMTHEAVSNTQFSLEGFPGQEYDEYDVQVHSNPIASIERNEYGESTLIFNKAGEVTLYFFVPNNTDYKGYVNITSTFNRIDEEELRESLEIFKNLELFYRQSKQISFNVTPFDFANYYDVLWTSSEGISLMLASDTNIFVQATQVAEDQFIRVEFRPKDITFPATVIYLDVTVANFGVNDITFELRNDESFKRGLERTYVFGNTNIIGEDFVFEMRFFIQSPPGALALFNFTSDNEDLAIINNTGIITFNRDFNDFDENGKALVTISARSVYPKLLNSDEYATAQYTFTVVNGANVSSPSDYISANNAALNIVLRSSISFQTPITTLGNLHGNGYTMDASYVTNNISDPTEIIFRFHNNNNMLYDGETLITNVVFTGFADADINLLRTRATLVEINANTTLQYSVLQRAAILLYVSVDAPSAEGPRVNENIHVYSNLFSYAGLAAAYLGSTRNRGLEATDIVFENIIIEQALIGIVFEPSDMREVEPNNRDAFELTLKGSVLFYNWIRVEELMRLSLTFQGETLGISTFDFDVETIEKDGHDYMQLSIVIIDLTDRDQNTYWWMTSARFSDENYTAQRIGTIATRTDAPSEGGTDFMVGRAVSRSFISIPAFITGTGYAIDIGRPILSVHNLRHNMADFVSPYDQVRHMLNPDLTLITRGL